MEDLVTLGRWAWFLAAAILMLLEIVLPGVFLFFIGLAAAATGLVDLVFPLSWQRELLLFAVLAIAFAVVGRNLMRRAEAPVPDKPFLNRRADALVGREFVLDEPIVNGVGRIRIDDSVWRALGPDAVAGVSVRVVAVDGATLRVTPSSTIASEPGRA
jgi:membrane protein implicated in regulation of membrane protease activity